MAFGIKCLRMLSSRCVPELKRTQTSQFSKKINFQSTIARKRNYSTQTSGQQTRFSGCGKPGFRVYAAVAAASVGVSGGYYLWTTQGGGLGTENEAPKPKYCPKYQRVYNAIAQILDDQEYDDGSYGPIFVRLAWHASGTYDVKTNTGGSNKATMRFEPEKKYDANKGLHFARERLEQVKEQFPWISYGDLWTLAGVCGVQEMGGPTVPWRPGRVDGTAAECPPDGRLPDGKKGTPDHPREIFYRMGFNDQELVALIGAHTLGRCHEDRSGFEGRWSNSPTSFSNSFFTELLNIKWVERKWEGNKQFQDEDATLMMLPTDMTLLQDCKFKKWVQLYAKDENKFFEDFANAYQKLLELGVPYPKDRQEFIFKTLENSQ